MDAQHRPTPPERVAQTPPDDLGTRAGLMSVDAFRRAHGLPGHPADDPVAVERHRGRRLARARDILNRDDRRR